MGEANIRRGEKWWKQRDFETNELPDWFKTQPSIVADIEEYLISIKPVKEEKTKSKKEK